MFLVLEAVGRGGCLATRLFGNFSCRLLLLCVCLLLQGLSDEDPADAVQLFMLSMCLLLQGLSDEEVAEAAKAAEAEAAVTSSLVQSSKADASDAQSRYYNLAHRSAADFPFPQCLPERI